MFIFKIEPLQVGKFTNDKNLDVPKKDSSQDFHSILSSVQFNEKLNDIDEKLSDIDQKLNIHNQSIKDLESLQGSNSSVNINEMKIPGYGKIESQSIDNVLSILKTRQEMLKQQKDFWSNISLNLKTIVR